MNHSLFKGKKMWLIIASCVCVLAVSAGITAAYFISTTETLVNEFDPSKVTCEVVETFDGNVKKDVAIRNTGNVNAYIRASVLINWVDEQNSNKVLAQAPTDSDYTIIWGGSYWVKGGDGFWYYQQPVAPGAVTNDLIDSVTVIAEAPEGYQLSVQIIATAIQAEPSEVVQDEWNVVNNNGVITPNA